MLAYSTVSQLGFMFLGVGVGAFAAGFFHVFTHAFFKACLFLGAGSVIHAMHARIHDDEKAQDIRNMGGLRKWLPLTHGTFAAATAAIIGLPFTSGFFSKDEILYRAFVDRTVNPMADSPMLRHFKLFEPPEGLGPVLYGVAVVAATLTAFYMCRLYFLTFWGDFKGWTVGRPSLLAKHEAAHGDDEHHDEDLSDARLPAPRVALADDRAAHHPGDVLAVRRRPQPGLRSPQGQAHRSLARARVQGGHGGRGRLRARQRRRVGGAHGVDAGHRRHLRVPHRDGPRLLDVRRREGQARGAAWPRPSPASTSCCSTSGASTSSTTRPSSRWSTRSPRPAPRSIAASIDGVLARFTALVVAASGTILRAFQNGVVHVYAAMMVVGLAVMTWFFAVPHANATVVDAGNDDYVVTAAPGVGLRLPLGRERRRTAGQAGLRAGRDAQAPRRAGQVHDVNLEVRNAFGLVQRKTITVARPQAPVSSL